MPNSFIAYMSFLLMVLTTLPGCSGKILNPYEESFGCPDTFTGSCDDVTTAYQKSLNREESWSPVVVVDDRREEKDDHSYREHTPQHSGRSKTSKSSEIYNFRKTKLTEVQGLIEDPTTPVLIPSKKMRLLVLGYEDTTNDYYGHRYIYFIADPERWSLPFNTMRGPVDNAETLFK